MIEVLCNHCTKNHGDDSTASSSLSLSIPSPPSTSSLSTSSSSSSSTSPSSCSLTIKRSNIHIRCRQLDQKGNEQKFGQIDSDDDSIQHRIGPLVNADDDADDCDSDGHHHYHHHKCSNKKSQDRSDSLNANEQATTIWPVQPEIRCLLCRCYDCFNPCTNFIKNTTTMLTSKYKCCYYQQQQQQSPPPPPQHQHQYQQRQLNDEKCKQQNDTSCAACHSTESYYYHFNGPTTSYKSKNMLFLHCCRPYNNYNSSSFSISNINLTTKHQVQKTTSKLNLSQCFYSSSSPSSILSSSPLASSSSTASVTRTIRTTTTTTTTTATTSTTRKTTIPQSTIFSNFSPSITLSLTCTPTFLMLCTLFVIFAFSPLHGVAAIANDMEHGHLTPGAETGVCQSKDIRNTPSQLHILKGCRVIEGFLIISLIDHSNETDYDNMEFPELVEITDYFILYRANGLKSLAKLFPNLRVIRGNNLLQDYAFIIYEMMNLHEIGLKSLTYIGRGGVRIEKNPMLCFVDTIDWTVIASNTGNKDHILNSNKPANECPICPSGKKAGDNENNNNDQQDELDCPISQSDSKKRLCWNRQNCQKICPAICGNRSCNNKGQCCDESCLSSCTGDKLDNCEVCRYLTVYDQGKRQCVKNCPNRTFEHHGRRCITESECQSVPRSIISDNSLPKYPMIPFQNKCSSTCPIGYLPAGESGKRFCSKCDGPCQKGCTPGTIDSIASAQQYRGCSRVAGSILIQIKSQGGHNVVKELDTALSDIEEIDGSLKIVRSFPIVSLSFFKKLRVIHGKTLETERYALYVMDNQNLQGLFPQNITIERGKLFFHFNPKLCYSNIVQLKDGVEDLKNVSKLAIEDVSINSNGDKVACNVTKLNATVVMIASVAAIIDVEAMSFDDERVLLGYVLHYIVAPYRNVTFYDGRDACGGDGWKIEDVTSYDREGKVVNVLMTRLKPYTQYAYYIKTYTIATERNGGQSDIQYFTTLPDKPEAIRKLSVSANGSHELIVLWEPPKKANGKLTTYIIKVFLAYDDEQLLDQRNYCNEQMIVGTSDTISIVPVPKPGDSIIPKEPTCDCEAFDEDSLYSRVPDAEAEQMIDFEDELQNLIYVKKVPIDEGYRRRRSIDVDTSNKYVNESSSSIIESTTTTTDLIVSEDDFNTVVTSKPIVEEKKPRKVGDYYEYFYATVNASTISYVVRDLKHYSLYSVSVKACREGPGENCSTESIYYQRTNKIESADNIKYINVQKLENTNNSLGSVKITWPLPEKPNGIIVSYTIRYQRVDLEHSKGQDICINHRFNKNLSGEYHMKHLENGNYSFMVMATSLAGPGKWSPAVYYFVDERRVGLGTILGAILGGVIGVVITGVVVWFILRRKYGRPVSDLKLIASVNPEYVSMQYQPDEWEVARDKILQIRELGQGSFGMVYEGIVKNLNKNNEEIRCAIKTVNENATDRERINFLKEASVMKAFNTHHVVRLLGVVSCGQPTLVIMELMENGDLKGYLRSHRSDSDTPTQLPPSLKRILQMAIEIADGMAYLSAKKFVHRDLAARNCMVAGDLTVKIGDFGMTRDIYETDYYRKGTKGLLPVRWMSPESLKDGVFSSSSDVFSFGVVLWEMATLASQPYQGLSNDQVLRYVIDGGVMERPENCPDKLYRLMCRTWQHRPSARPSFLQIVSTLLDDAAPSFRNVSFYHSPEGQELLQQPQHQSLTIDVTTPLKAEEDDFSLEGLDDSYLMDLNKSNVDDEGAAHSPLSKGIGLKRIIANSIPDVALGKSNKNSPVIAATQSVIGRNSGNINRGIEFLRNAFFGQNESNSCGESKDYRKLNYQPPSQSQYQQQQQQPQQQLQQQQQQQQHEWNEQCQYDEMQQHQQENQLQHQQFMPVSDNSLSKKRQLSNGYVAVKKNNAHIVKHPTENLNESFAYKQEYELTLC